MLGREILTIPTLGRCSRIEVITDIMRANFWMALVAVLMTLIPVSSQAEVKDSLSYMYYVVIANPNLDIVELVDQQTPLKYSDGEIFHGETDWDIGYTYEVEENPEYGCRIAKVHVNLTTVIRLPKLVGANNSPINDYQKDDFAYFMKGLKAHELGHYKIAKKAAAEINRSLRDLPEMSYCVLIEPVADRLYKSILRKYRAEEVRYDKVTKHGQN